MDLSVGAGVASTSHIKEEEPCWIGEDPDNGTCDTVIAWRFDDGNVEGVDVTGTTIAVIAHVPGNILQGNWKAAVYISDNATQKQEEALLKVYTGKLGGPVGDLVKLIAEVVSVERVPITFDVRGGKGTLKVGSAGYGSIGWMLALAAVMAAEKNLRGGQRLSAPVGAALLAWAAVIVVTAVGKL